MPPSTSLYYATPITLLRPPPHYYTHPHYSITIPPMYYTPPMYYAPTTLLLPHSNPSCPHPILSTPPLVQLRREQRNTKTVLRVWISMTPTKCAPASWSPATPAPPQTPPTPPARLVNTILCCGSPTTATSTTSHAKEPCQRSRVPVEWPWEVWPLHRLITPTSPATLTWRFPSCEDTSPAVMWPYSLWVFSSESKQVSWINYVWNSVIRGFSLARRV